MEGTRGIDRPDGPCDEVFCETQPLWNNMIVRVLAPISSLTAVVTLLVVALAGQTSQRWTLLGVAALVLGVDALVLFGLRLKVRVNHERVRVAFAPFASLTVRRDRILAADAVTFDALSEFGGWGPRRSKKYGRVFIIAGDNGVLLTLDDGSMVLLGSGRSEELTQILQPKQGSVASGV